MIFYFSATGNCKHVATYLAEAPADRKVSITDCLKEKQFAFVMAKDENIGFITPTYNWGLPTTVVDFLNQLQIQQKGTHYVYHVLTFGTTTGQAHRMLEKGLQRHGLTLDAKFNVQTVDTWTPIFDLSKQEKVQKTLLEADNQIRNVTAQVKSKTKGDFDNRKVPFAELYYATYVHGRKTSKFTVDDTCISCGLCAKQCPVCAIDMREKKPTWVKEQCTLCLGCLHRCPKFSIQYGKNTRKHGQYVNPHVKL